MNCWDKLALYQCLPSNQSCSSPLGNTKSFLSTTSYHHLPSVVKVSNRPHANSQCMHMDIGMSVSVSVRVHAIYVCVCE